MALCYAWNNYFGLAGRVRSAQFFFFQAEDGIRDLIVTGVQTCALPIWRQTNHQNVNCPFMGGMSEMPGPFYMHQGGTGLLNKNATRIGEFYGSSLVARDRKSVV